jgi:hypothetical protein
MLMPKVLDVKTKALIAVAFAGWLTMLACTVSVKDHDGENGKVDIQTPVGGMHIDGDANVKDTGLSVYPGARKKVSTDNDSKNANVNISSGFFGVKVVAIEYESDDAPGKVQAFYQDQLQKFGHVIQCRTSKHGGDLNVKAGHESSAREVRCDGDNSGNIIELKVGTEDNQHLVSVEPRGNGTDFSLVYIQTRGKQGTI